MNINMFSFFDDEGRARHPLIISRQNYDRVAHLFNWKNHYAPIANISRRFLDITNINNQKHFCLRFFGHCLTEEVFSRHMEHCTRDDFMSGAPYSPYARLKTGPTQILQL